MILIQSMIDIIQTAQKYDSGHTDDPDMIPMWVADMDFKILPDIPEALSLNVCQMVFMVIVQSRKNT